MDALEQPTLVFTLALALSLVIERVVEICKAAYDLLDSRYDWAAFWTRRTHRIRDGLEPRLRAHGWVDPDGAARILTRFDEMMLGGDRKEASVPILCGDLVRAVHVRAGTRALAIVLGIWAAATLNVDLVVWAKHVAAGPPPAPTTLGLAATGIVLGLGSALVHKAITHIEKRRSTAGEAA